MRTSLENFYRFIPRPIVLITSVDKFGRINAAPMSFVTPLEMEPPILAFSTSYESHTYRNIIETKEFVAALVTEKIKRQMWICGKSFPKGVNELDKAGLHWKQSKNVKPPLVIECPVNLECKLEWAHKGPEYVVIAGRVLACHINKEAISRGGLNVKKVRPLLHLWKKFFIVGDHPSEP